MRLMIVAFAAFMITRAAAANEALSNWPLEADEGLQASSDAQPVEDTQLKTWKPSGSIVAAIERHVTRDKGICSPWVHDDPDQCIGTDAVAPFRSYDRHYYGADFDGWRMVVGVQGFHVSRDHLGGGRVFISGDSESAEFPMWRDGGCLIVHVYADAATGAIINVACNGSA